MRAAVRSIALPLLAACACAGAPLPDDLAHAERLEAARRDEEALSVYATARASCQRAGARRYNDCGLAAFRYAQLLERLGRTALAAQAFLAVRDLSTDGRLSARALMRAATLYAHELKRRDEALRLCRLVLSRWPDELAGEDALSLLVRLRAGEAALGDELDQIARDLSRHAVSGWALLYRAELFEKAGDPGRAVQLLDELWRRFPRGPLRDDAAYRAAKILRAARRPREAAERLTRLQKTFTPAIVVGHYNKLLLDDAAILLGEIYLDDLREPGRAISALEGFLARQPTSLLADDALLLMARAALSRRDPPSDRDVREACGHLGRLLSAYAHGNRARAAQKEQARLGC